MMEAAKSAMQGWNKLDANNARTRDNENLPEERRK